MLLGCIGTIDCIAWSTVATCGTGPKKRKIFHAVGLQTDVDTEVFRSFTV